MQALFLETEDLLEKWKHPDPYHAPTAPGGWFLLGHVHYIAANHLQLQAPNLSGTYQLPFLIVRDRCQSLEYHPLTVFAAPPHIQM